MLARRVLRDIFGFEGFRPGQEAVIAALLDAGAKVHAVGAQGRMPLHQAASENANPEVVGELLRRGADVTARLAGGRTVVHEAAQGNPNRSTNAGFTIPIVPSRLDAHLCRRRADFSRARRSARS